ncbi:NAD(P)-dependent oxidoreductase, partial [Nostoc sp.]|uniref:NAD(P)-dependent oxidoreductase n=1 Tax=Nostoc sp. TaxID=1180 RepID=UPI00359371B6
MKIVVFEVEVWERETFRDLSNGHEVKYVQELLTDENASQYADANVISTFIYSDISAAVLKQLPHLKLIATRSTGYDRIDADYCQQHGVTICNVPTYGENTVAEHVFALLLAISHKIPEASDRTRKGDFSLEGLRGFDLQGKKLGVIGTGNIGQCVIEIAKGFRLEVIAFDVKQKQELTSQLGFRYVAMEELLSTADIITLHVPANEKTYHLLSTGQFAMMKDGVVLINTSRGSLVDVQALLHALAEGKVAAAGLDVLPEEPVMREEAELLRSVYRKQH